MPTGKRSRRFAFESRVVVWPGASAWRFLPLPREVAAAVKAAFGASARGWGSLPVSVRVGETVWRTSIFPDRASGTYLLPLKVAARRAAGIVDGARVAAEIDVL